jgi:toxin ParE1/3/4
MSPNAIQKQSRIVSTQLGRARPEIHAEARSIVIERWLALYRMTEHGVQIVRVLDGGRDLSAIEWTPE